MPGEIGEVGRVSDVGEELVGETKRFAADGGHVCGVRTVLRCVLFGGNTVVCGSGGGEEP